MLAFGRLTELPSILAQIGGISLQAHEAREEQDGTVLRQLPIATDPRFVVENTQESAEDTDAENGTEIPTPDDESHTDGETGAGTQEPGDTEGEVQRPPKTEGPETVEDGQETINTDNTEVAAEINN